MAKERGAFSSDARRPARILVVDDEPDVLKMLERMLGSRYCVETRSTASDAVARIEQGGIEVVVSDVVMPGMTGLELLRAIRAHEPDLPVILVTGFPALGGVTEAIASGVFRYLEKPIEPRVLEETIEQASKLHRLARMKREAFALHGVRGGASDLLGLEIRLERTLESFAVAFQPVVSLSNRSIIGYEAFLRTRHWALSGPLEVLDAAERLDAIPRVGRLVREWAARLFYQAPDESLLFLNLHPLELTDPELLDENASLTEMAERVILEIPERASLVGIEHLDSHLAALRARGYRLAVDNLGAGRAGLANFALLEPNVVKLDGALARNVNTSSIKQGLVASMVSLCKDMNMTVIAEGIERPAERDTLLELGCDLLQGFLFARPGPPFPAARW